MSFTCHLYAFIFYLYVFVCHSYVSCVYSFVICVSLVYTRMSSVCHSHVLVCHPYVTRMWFYHEPNILVTFKKLQAHSNFPEREFTLSRLLKKVCVENKPFHEQCPYTFQSESLPCNCWMSRKSLLETGTSES